MAVAITLTALFQDSSNAWFLLIVAGVLLPVAGIIARLQEQEVRSDDPDDEDEDRDDPDDDDGDDGDDNPSGPKPPAAGPQIEVPPVRLPSPGAN